MPKITFMPDNITAEIEEGQTILKAARRAHAQVGYACGGVCACSTCHVYVKKGLDSLSEKEDKEEDRLDQAFDPRLDSRLSCQARVGDEDIVCEITRESRQAWFDEHPEERDKKPPELGTHR